MEKVSIQELISRCIQYFKEHCYTENRISKYKSLWNTGILRYMAVNGLQFYDPDVGESFKETCHQDGEVRHQEREKIRSVEVLNDLLKTGETRLRTYTPMVHDLSGKIGEQMEKLIVHLVNLRRSKTTVNGYRLYLSEFLFHLKQNGVSDVYEISDIHILSFIHAHPTNKVNIVSALRVLFRFWVQNKIADNKFVDLFEGYKIKRPEKVPSYFTGQEVMQIEQSVSRSSAIGKRNYAMLLFASRLGLRASDIAGIQLCDIDWDNNKIILEMKKTKKKIELPLLAEVGNAIIDYLRNGRPNSQIGNIFLSQRAPYRKATKEMVCSAINRIILSSGVSTEGKHHGPHSLRHSLASALLKDGATMPVISESLGHRSTQTTMTYLKIDTDTLRMCTLEVPCVPDEFYLQKGGAFYG